MMNISTEGRDILENINEILDSQYECYRMITAFDHGKGAEGLPGDEIIKVINKSRGLLTEFVDALSPEDTYEILNRAYNIDAGNYLFAVAFDVSKERLITCRTLNELLSKYLRIELNMSDIDYTLILSQYLTIDMVNVLISILNKMLPNFDDDMKRQITIAKYSFIFCIKEVEDELINKKFKIEPNTYAIAKSASSMCGIDKATEKSYIDTWAIKTFGNTLNIILDSKHGEPNIVNIVNSAILRTVIALVDEDLASDLMHDAMDKINTKKDLSEYNSELLFDAITSRFEDETIPLFVSFRKKLDK